jgi:hypothetical protein
MKAKKGIKFFWIVFVLITLLIPFISSATVVVNTPPEEKEPSFFETYFGFLLSPLFWGFVIFFIIFLLILVGVFFIVKWIVGFLKSKNDIFYQLRKDRIKLSKIHSSYNSKHWYKVHKNIPIRLVSKDTGKLVVSEPVAYHRGNYVTNEGNLVISLNLKGNNKWFIFPITSLLIIPNKSSINIVKKGKNGKDETVTIDNIPLARDIIQFNQGEILLFAESVSNVGEFYVPVLKAKDGKIIDLALSVYQSLREVVLGNYLYEQTQGFVNVAKKTMDLNPNLRYEVKAKDSNTNVEVPQGQNK